MTSTQVDIVTVFHCEQNREQTNNLVHRMLSLEVQGYNYITVDNTEINRGFAGGCNLGAAHGTSPFILFLNPDVIVEAPFLRTLLPYFDDDNLVIAGERFGKPPEEYALWGCIDWVCGACLMVRRSWFDEVRGFRPEYMWGWEETDLIRQAQQAGRGVKSLELPVTHSSPEVDSDKDAAFKRLHFQRGAEIFRSRWL
jgi:GT2 family glycosyltransferase